VPKATWHWGSDSSVVNDPLGQPGRNPFYVGLLSTWGSVDGDIPPPPPILDEGSFFMGSSRPYCKCSKFSRVHIKVPEHTKKSRFGFLSWTQSILRCKSWGHLELW
jgi:hypothetical protein